MSAGVPGHLDGPAAPSGATATWRKPLSGGFRVVQVMCLSTGATGLVALAASPVDSWFRNGIGAVVGVLIAVVLAWTTWFGAGWAYLRVHRGQVRMGFAPLVWVRPGFPLDAVAAVRAIEVDLLDHGGRFVGGDPAQHPGLLVSSGGREAVRFELWDGQIYVITLRNSDEVVERLRRLVGGET